ncbi:MAG: minichromosome maintenance protein MCM, partial [Deltaproteobacteria bacterium]|nr:minichromosome maintenance protein MCM [Deltaproteobacteria bacterium]
DGKCSGKKGPDGKEMSGACLQPIEIPLGSRVLIAGVRATEGQLQKLLRDYVCDKDKRPVLVYQDEDRLTVREVFAHQVVGPMAPERLELVEKPIYVVGGHLVEIGKYRAIGKVTTAYRDQQPTLLVDAMERLDEDYQGFTVEKYRANLEKVREMSPDEIAADLSVHVTRIYGRPDLHLGTLLVLCSPLGFDFPGEGIIRGWLTAIMVGDSGVGKTTVSEGLLTFAEAGQRVSGMTSSRTGITYACDHDERRGWRIKAGALLKMTRQVLLVDEAQDIPMEELKTMAEGLDTGLVRIDKIQNKVFESRTRVLFGCNPIHPKRAPGQRTMDSFRYGCEAIKGIFPEMMVRRIDFAIFAASWDIEDKEKIYFPEKPAGPQQVTREDLRALIFYAWNLRPDQIVIDDNTAHYIRQTAKYLSDKFGGSDDLPIVYPEDFRKTMARLSVAYAVLDLSTTEDFSQVIVKPGHVAEVCELLERIYEAENARLDAYSTEYRRLHGLADHKKIEAGIARVMQGDQDRRYRFLFILRELLKNETVRQRDLFETLGVTRQTVHRDMNFFTRFNLVTSSTREGYRRTPKLIRVVKRIEKESPDLLPWQTLDEEEDL